MQHNTTETGATPTSRSPENNTQPSITNSAAVFSTRTSHNPRFAITPETMGMNLRSDTPTPTREQIQHEAPLVDVKSYYERHNKNPTVGLLSDYKPESNASFHSSHSNTPTNSYGSIRTTSCYPIKTPSPNVSPKTPSSQQWNFDHTIKPEYVEQHNNIYTSSASLCPKQSAHTYIKYPQSSTRKSPDAAAYSYVQNVTSMSDIALNHGNEDHHHYQKYRSGSDVCAGDSAKLNYNLLNELYSKRIENIDATVCGNKDLKIVTYQEWVEMLTKISESLITNMNQLEKDVADHVELIQRKVNSNCRHSQGNELMKCRKDIDTLLKYIKNARNYNSWNLQGFTFETITPAQVLDVCDFEISTIEGNGADALKNNNETEVMQKNKLYANMKALAHEVAEKHDEVRELKRQVISMEDEIQKAQQKIQLKDDVIKELRNDLKCANHKFSAQHSVDTGLIMPPINFEDQTSLSANTQLTHCSTPRYLEDNGCQFDSLSQTELEEQQKFKDLGEAINEVFEINKQQTEENKQKMEDQRKWVMAIIPKLQSEKSAAYRQLDFIRNQLIDLESDCAEGNNDCDSGFHSKSENDQDAKLLEAVRKRLRKLNDTNAELKKRVQKLELENSDLSNSLHSEKTFSQRYSETLKEVADLLCNMNGKKFSYTNIYNNERNPFCEAIEEMKEDFQERECQLLKAVTMTNKQVEKLTQSLVENDMDFNQEGTLTHLNVCDLKDINTTLSATTSHQPLPVTSTSTSTSSTLITTLSTTSMTGQQLDPTTAASPQGSIEK